MENGQALKFVTMMAVIASTVFVLCDSAVNHTVGGDSGWDVSSNVQAWAANTSFHAGDFLVFDYTPLHDVLEVNRMEFGTCKTINPIDAYSNSPTVVPLRKPGVTRYFFCGRYDHCSRGLKLQVHVVNTQSGRDQRDRHPVPVPVPVPNPSPDKDPATKDDEPVENPSPNSGTWRGKQDGWFGCLQAVAILVAATMVLGLSLC